MCQDLDGGGLAKKVGMEPIHQIQKKFGSRAMVTAVIAGMVFILVGQKPIAKGLVLGSIFSVINFILMGEILPMIISTSRKRSVLFSFVSMLFRFLFLEFCCCNYRNFYGADHDHGRPFPQVNLSRGDTTDVTQGCYGRTG